MADKRRVWIELEPPKAKGPGPEREVQGDAIAEMANNMLRRLNGDAQLQQAFFWSDRENRFCYGGDMGYITLNDNGQWFNLEHLGRPIV